MKTSTLTALSRRLDKTLTHFALAANAGGQYPWEVAQQQKRNRQMVGTAVGAAAVGAGAYGAKKGHEAIMKHGLPMAQAAAGGPVRTRDAYKAVAGDVMDKTTKRVGAYGKNLKGAYQGSRAGTAGLGWKKPGMSMGKAALAALKGVRFSEVGRLVELEAQLDGALQEFAQDDRRKNYAAGAAGVAAAGAAGYGADRAIMGRAKKKMGFTPTRAEAYGEGVKDVMKSGKRLYRKGKAQVSYHGGSMLRKAKDMMGVKDVRKVAGLLK